MVSKSRSKSKPKAKTQAKAAKKRAKTPPKAAAPKMAPPMPASLSVDAPRDEQPDRRGTTDLMSALFNENDQSSAALVIPWNRPVVGGDLEALREALALSLDEAKYIFGISGNRWNTYKQELAQEPIGKPSLALLVRYYAAHPERVPRLNPPSPHELLAVIQGSMKELSILMGMEGAAGFRWIKRNGSMSPTAQRLALHLMREATSGNLGEWRRMVAKEALARGVPDIFNAVSWTPPGAPPKEFRRRPGTVLGRPRVSDKVRRKRS